MDDSNDRAIVERRLDEGGTDLSVILETRYEISTEDRKIEHEFLNLVIPAGGEAPQISLIDPFKESEGTKESMRQFTKKHGQGIKTEKPSTQMSKMLKTDIDI